MMRENHNELTQIDEHKWRVVDDLSWITLILTV